MSEKFQNDIKNEIKEYIKYDNYIKAYEKKIEKAKEIRKSKSESIIGFFSKNNIKNKDIKAGNSLIQIKEKTTTQGLSQKFLKETIKNYFHTFYSNFSEKKCIELSENIIEYINKSKKKSKKISLKRIIG